MRKSKYVEVDVNDLQDMCDIVSSFIKYQDKKNKKLNRKINILTIIFGGALISSVRVLAEEIDNLKLKCK